MNLEISSDLTCNENDHKIYSESILNLGISPEYNNGEVMLASLYRQIGWKIKSESKYSRFSEAQVNKESVHFFDTIRKAKNSPGDIHLEDWRIALDNVLSSPKMPKQIKSRNPILYPIIPDCALYSSASRLKGNPWNPGKLIEQVIVTGSSNTESKILWDKLFKTLSCDEKDNKEDIWARLMASEFSKWRSNDNLIWSLNQLTVSAPSFDQNILCASPASQFVSDLDKTLDLKDKLTRRQWLSVVESLIRIACASHVLWNSKLNDLVWDYIKKCLNGKDLSQEKLNEKFISSGTELWKLEEKATPSIQSKIKSATQGKIAINFILKALPAADLKTFNFNSVEGIYNFGQLLKTKINKQQIERIDIINRVQDIYDKDPKLMSCKKGYSKSLYEFLRHSLGQKQTAEPQKRSYDQSYWLRKKGNYSSAPWVVDMGPTSILTMAYCCSYGYDQPRTIKDFLQYLNKYGFIITQPELENSNLLSSLTTLQIIIDSPDAEGGRVIIDPFDNTK